MKKRNVPILFHISLSIIIFSLSACSSTRPALPQDDSPLETTRVKRPELVTSPTRAREISTPEQVFTTTPTITPTQILKTFEATSAIMIPEPQTLTITILYDNHPYDPRLKSGWGFSALVAYDDHKLLFDTGNDGAALIENMRTLEIEPADIENIILSHAHGDHIGGLSTLLEPGIRPAVYVLPTFPSSIKRQIEQSTRIVEVIPGQTIIEGIVTTGEMGSGIPEQAMVIKTPSGLVVITGCAHPGIVSIISQAHAMFGEPVRLVLGGFHLGSKTNAEIDSILKDFRRIGVEQVAPCHCTGEHAIALFATEYGQDYIQVGIGSVIRLD